MFGLEIEKKESRKPKRSNRAGTVKVLQVEKMYLLTRTYTTVWSKDKFFKTLTKLRLAFLVTDLSQHFEIYLVAFALKFDIHG